MLLGTKLDNCRWIHGDPEAEPLDALPFRELWEDFYRKEIKTEEMLLELYLYQKCRAQRNDYERNLELYRKVFGSGLLKKPPFKKLVQGLRYGAQAGTVIDTLFTQYVPAGLKARWGLKGTAKLLAVLEASNAFYECEEKRWNGEKECFTKRAAELPIFKEMRWWLSLADEGDWGSAFTLRFKLQEFYDKLRGKEVLRRYDRVRAGYLTLADYVDCYVKGIWDKDLFYKAVFTFLSLKSLIGPASTVEQKGAVSSRDARIGELNAFFGQGVILPVDGKYHFDQIGDEVPAMKLAHEIYQEAVPLILKVELKRGGAGDPILRIRIIDSGDLWHRCDDSDSDCAWERDITAQFRLLFKYNRAESRFKPSAQGVPAKAGGDGRRLEKSPEGNGYHKEAAGGAGHVCAAVDSSFGGIFESAGIPERLLLFYGPHRGTAG